MDWKDALSKLNLPDAPEETNNDGDISEKDVAAAPVAVQKEKLSIFYEKKGRGGKKATIITGFACSDEELQEIAGKLKKLLGTGGSARGGEILIQGDAREKVASALKEMGFRTGGF